MDERGRAPYQETKEPSHTSCGTAVCGMEFQFSAVPSGKRLVVTGVSVDFIVLTGASVFAGELELGATSLFLPFLRQGGPLVPGTEEWVSNQQVTFYIEPTRAPTVFANVDPSHVSNERSFATLTGYYVSVP